MQVIHEDGFSSESERAEFRTVIFGNTIQSMQVLINACFDLNIAMGEENEALAELILNTPVTGDEFGEDVGNALKVLWEDKGILEAYDHASELQLNDSAKYYFDALDRICEEDYTPTKDDVLRSRVRTTGIVEFGFKAGNLNFKIMDVGGQRNERKKWIHCFADVTAIIFVASLSEYDQVLYEDNTQNRMVESLALFDEICNGRYFSQTTMILFLNKMDLFEEKIAKVDLNVCFPEYTGGKDFDAAADFITQKFVDLNKNPDRTIFPHMTCATNTENVSVIFSATKETVIMGRLREGGLV